MTKQRQSEMSMTHRADVTSRPPLLNFLTCLGMVCAVVGLGLVWRAVENNQLLAGTLGALCLSGVWVFYELRHGRYWSWVAIQVACSFWILASLGWGAVMGPTGILITSSVAPAILTFVCVHRPDVKTFCGVPQSQVDGWPLLACVGLVFVLPFFGVVLPLVQYDCTKLPGAYSTFLSRGLNEPDEFVSKLKQRSDRVSSYIYKRLRESTRADLEQASSPSPALQAALIDDLNDIIRGPSLWNEVAQAGVRVRQETQAMQTRVLQEELIGYAVAPLNRLLLEDAYPTELSREQAKHGFALMISMDAWLVLAASLYGMRLGIALWRVEAGAVRNTQRLLLLRLAYTLAFTAILFLKFPRETWDWFTAGLGRWIFPTGVAHAIWLAYFHFAKRVKIAFRES